MVQSIYEHRRFFVIDSTNQSQLHSQAFGISQGCPLSPFLFVIVMTVLMVDVRARFQEEYGDVLSQNLPVHTLLYADDILLMDVSAQSLEKFMMLVVEFGKEYRLELN